ncbi:unnamed protein product, partial [Allacma fusca]
MGRYKQYVTSPQPLQGLPARSRSRLLKKTVGSNFQSPSRRIQIEMEQQDNYESYDDAIILQTQALSHAEDEQFDDDKNEIYADSEIEDDCSESSESGSPISDYEELYMGSKLSSSESHILILAFVQRYKLSKKGTEDLHELINLHVPKNVNFSASTYMLKK